MKQLFIALMVALAFTTTVYGQKKDTIQKQQVNKTQVATPSATPAEPEMKVDPESGLEYVDVIDSTRPADRSDSYDIGHDLGQALRDAGINGKAIGNGMAIGALTIILIFGFPFVVVFLAFYFRYKNKKAKYKVIEQALASGQPLPEQFLKETKEENKRSQGINQTFLGLGMFIFLWAITGQFGIGCIGLLIMCIGLGKWITSLDKNRSDRQR